jgi:tRNA(Ile)-lysidine synthase
MSSISEVFRRGGCADHLLPAGSRILVGLSGGVDSMVLTALLRAQAPARGWQLGLAHIDHGLRQGAADDAAFVRAHAHQWGLPFYERRVRVSGQAAGAGVSLEMAARTARREALCAMARREGFEFLALAHTQDDQAETVLLRLLRGAGYAGLAAMRARSDWQGVPIVRPLLSIPKKAIIRWAQRHGLAWREDESNADAAFTRNRIRHELLPLLAAQYNPAIVEVLARTAALFEGDARTLAQVARNDLENCLERLELQVDIWRRLSQARRRRVLHEWLVRCGVAANATSFNLVERLEQVMDRSGRERIVEIDGGARVVRSGNRLRYEAVAVAGPIGGAPQVRKLARPGRTECSDWGLVVRIERVQGFQRPADQRLGTWPAEAWLSARAIGRAGLYLRAWQAGDAFIPWGLSGSRKVQDIFMDAKVPRSQRQHMPLLICRGRIAWVPGYRMAQNMALTNPREAAWHVRIDRTN